MAHQSSTVSGRAEVFVAGKPAWHGLGVTVDAAQTAEAAIHLAGLDWRVYQRPLSLPDGTELPDKVANVRSALDGRDVYLGTVGVNYRPIQNREAFAFMDELVGRGEVLFETAGAIRDGRRVWMLARLPENLEVDSEDQINQFLLLANGHDGSLPLRIFFSPVRVVCANTLNAALRAGDGISIRHRGDIRGKMEEARRVLGLARAHYGQLGQVFRQLKRVELNISGAHDYFKALVPDPSVNAGPKTLNRVNRVRSELLSAFNVEADQLAGRTLWAAYNAATRWSDHVAFQRRPSATQEARFENIIWGGGRLFKQAAFELAVSAMS